MVQLDSSSEGRIAMEDVARNVHSTEMCQMVTKGQRGFVWQGLCWIQGRAVTIWELMPLEVFTEGGEK